MKKMNNKGFSLVELIIVIAIMAVLVGVLAPQFLKYVESSRQSRDEQAMGEVNNAVKIACANDKVFSALPDKVEVKFGKTKGNPTVATCTELDNELKVTVGEVEAFSSKKYKDHEATTVVSVDKSSWSVKVETTCTAAAGDPFTVK